MQRCFLLFNLTKFRLSVLWQITPKTSAVHWLAWLHVIFVRDRSASIYLHAFLRNGLEFDMHSSPPSSSFASWWSLRSLFSWKQQHSLVQNYGNMVCDQRGRSVLTQLTKVLSAPPSLLVQSRKDVPAEVFVHCKKSKLHEDHAGVTILWATPRSGSMARSLSLVTSWCLLNFQAVSLQSGSWWRTNPRFVPCHDFVQAQRIVQQLLFDVCSYLLLVHNCSTPWNPACVPYRLVCETLSRKTRTAKFGPIL